ncbi:nucleolar protein 14 [Erpetoichthys calabaricus]|uniref:nucleolar protein 14 n=1 Tax=Erpetoichthys calabaricus TaxID=27687 RepID=UPI0022344FE8|nr:nucleolar protein 14 [Erpetoichthys calabaricus]
MGKFQQKKNLSDKVRKMKATSDIKNNPFEVKINRQKFDILGRKSKHDVGLPGVSRSKAMRRRKETLLKEYRLKDKSNKLIDKRIGEYDSKMASEDKILKRFALERQRIYGKKDIYNLNEEEELTHFGQSLANIEKLNDRVDSDSDSEEKGLLSAELTAAHFGGGVGNLLRKKASPGEKGKMEEPKQKSRKELIDELIAKSKLDKHERQTQKEESEILTEKLDSEWKSIQSLVSRRNLNAALKKDEKSKPDEYDMMVRELGFEMKAKPSDRMKSEEELAREERERLEKLESDRLRRMQGDFEESSAKKRVHFSADDLNDGFILTKEDRQLLTYKDGKLCVKLPEKSNKECDEEQNESENEEENEEEEDEEVEDSDSEDHHSDLESNEDSEGESEDQTTEENKPKAMMSRSETEKSAQKEAAELPYTFAAPETYSDLKSLLLRYSPEKQSLIIQRINKCNHPSLAVGNKAKLEKLFGFLFEYVGDLAIREHPDFGTISLLVPHLYDLCQLFPEAACKCVQSIFRDSAHDIEEVVEVKGKAPLPGLPVMVYLKISAMLFPTSDFRHPVVTPILVYMSQLLTKCPITSLQDVAKGLLLCCLFIEYVSLSQKFVPELISYLLGILHLSVPEKHNLGYTPVPPFRAEGKRCDLLVLKNVRASESWMKKSFPLSAICRLELKNEMEQDHFRLSSLATCLDLVKRCVSLYGSLPLFSKIFQPITTLIEKHLPVTIYPVYLQELIENILQEVKSRPSLYVPLVFDKQKPVPLKLYTPKIVQILDNGRRRGGTKKEQEKQRLIHKYKKEFKGAIREIRRDSQFLAREKLSEIMERDAERKRKVKQLFGNLATQEGEWKALKKKKMKG